MGKQVLILKVTKVIVVCMGLVPGLATILLTIENPFMLREGPFWQSLVVGIPSLILGLYAGLRFSKWFYEKWFRNSDSESKKALMIFLVTLVAGLLAVMVSWELNWIIAKLTGWGYLTELPWLNLLIGLPIMMFYSLVPGLIVSILNGCFTLFYLRSK